MFSINDITYGDIVKLTDGRSVVVDSLWTSWTDREGEHPGPGITIAGSYEKALLLEVAEIVLKNDRICTLCGEGVTSTNPEVDFCRGCHYTGSAATRDLAPLIDALTALDKVAAASVWHTGGGCFLLAVTLTDGRVATCTAGEASLPDEHEPNWQYVALWKDEDTFWDGSNDYLACHEDVDLDNDGFVALIATL